MPIFKYRGYSATGGNASGTVEADGIKDAAAKVKALGLYPRDIELSSRKRRWGFRRRNESARLPTVTRQLSVLIAAGVPLVEALRAVSKETTGQWQDMLVDIREKVVGGASLSRAMEEYEKIFPEFYRNMVAAGEQSGTLEKVLVQLADFLESQDAVKAKIQTAMVYPVIMAFVGFVVLTFIFTYVVPKIVKIFEDRESALPLITQILIAVSNFFIDYWWVLLIAGAFAVWGGKRYNAAHRVKVDRFLMRVFQSLYLSRFSRTLAFLLAGGIPMLRSLELAGKTTGNQWLNSVIRKAEGRVSEGSSLSSSLEGISPVMLELISTGEKSGMLSEVLEKAADTYETEFDRMVQRALALLEPIMILAMGGVVCFIVLAVLLPMFQMNQLIR